MSTQTSSTSPDSAGGVTPSLQLLPSTSFVRPRDRKRPDHLQRNRLADSNFVLTDPPHLQRSQTSPGFSLHRRNHSFDAATPTPTGNRFFIPFSKARQRTGSFDSPLRSAFDPALTTPDFPPRTSADPKAPLFSPQDQRASQISSPLRRGSNPFSPGTPSRLQQQLVHDAQPQPHHSRDDSSRFSIQSSNRSSGPPPLPASLASFLPAFTFQPGISKAPTQSTYTGYEAQDIIPEESSGESDMPSPKARDLRVEIKDTPIQPPLTNPPNLPKRTASLKKSSTPKRAQSTKKSFWNWGSSSKDDETMDAPTSPQSPAITPISAAPQSATRQAPPPSPGYFADDNYYASDDGYTSRSASPPPFSAVPSGSADTNTLIKELEDISTELASSIRREMDLEDEIDRLRTEMPSGPTDLNRRTSDYYSDSGASSARFPPPDVDLKLEGLEKMRRKAEQEKAQLRVDMAQKVQEDLNQRRALEMHIQSLEEQLSAATSSGGSGSGKERELETQLDDMKRRLNDEKSFKENFEDLLAGMREEIESFKHERDNLRDEVVPKISAENQNLIYENTRMQQELQNLKNENSTLQNARKLQLHSSIKSIVEEGPGSPESGLSRSNSLKRSGSLNHSKSVRGRSGSLMGQQQAKDMGEPEALPERVKNAEEQRDAIQRTLKSLILRQTQMSRQHAKQIFVLQTERDRALSGIPRRAGFAVEVHTLRHEVNKLRQRADDALEQKFQCEKGLTGLKMDLERAQQETSSLRDLLQEHDITVPDLASKAVTMSEQGDSLARAFEELTRAHADSIAAGTHSSADAHASRVAALSEQVSSQNASNQQLRARLAEAVGRGEKEQAASAKKINELQSALRTAEERVMSAQSVSEDVMASHEEHVRDIKDAASDHSQRMMKTPGKGMSTASRSGSATAVFERTRLSKTTSGKGVSAAEAIQVRALQTRVRELEDAAGQADDEMQGVVERMNAAQIEVADLQVQRDEAQKQTRKLQKEIETERLQYGN